MLLQKGISENTLNISSSYDGDALRTADQSMCEPTSAEEQLIDKQLFHWAGARWSSRVHCFHITLAWTEHILYTKTLEYD